MVNVRMAADEIAMLKELADVAGLSASDIVRTLIRDAHAKLEAKRSKR